MFGCIFVHVDGCHADELVVALLHNEQAQLRVVHLYISVVAKHNAGDGLEVGLQNFVVLNEHEAGVLQEDICFGRDKAAEGLHHFGILKLSIRGGRC